jgi:hypothetical protein
MSAYTNMESLITAYGFDFNTFRSVLADANGIIAGSSVARVLFDSYVKNGQLKDFKENDIDIFVSTFCGDGSDDGSTSNRANIDSFKSFLKDVGYTYNADLSVDSNSNKLRYMPSDKIESVATYTFNGKKIQVVTVTIDVVEFIKTETDISITTAHWIAAQNTIVYNFDTDSLSFYIDNQYVDILKEDDTDFKKRLTKRINKYIKRGFTMIEK